MRVLVVFFIVALVTGTAVATGEQVPDPVGEPVQQSTAGDQAPEPLAEPAQESVQAPPAAPAPVLPTGKVTRASFTTGIENREPVDSIDTLTNDQSQVFFFTEVMNLTGQTVTHRWEYKDQVMAEVSFDVGGPRWRVYSSKRLFPGWLGDWTVVVTDASQNELGRHSLAYVPGTPPVESGIAAPEAETAPPAPIPAPDEGSTQGQTAP